MPSFCVSCGSPLGGQSGFCGNCGARAGQAPSGQPAAVATPAAIRPAGTSGGGGSALKIVLIVVGVMFVFGALSIAGMYYTAHRYVKMAEDVTGIKAGDVVQSIREAATRNAQGARAEKRDGCLLLSKEEASAILGIEVERVDGGKPNEPGSVEHCDFFVKPGSVAQNLEKLRKSADAIKDDPNSPPQANKLPPGAADMIKTFSRGMAEGIGNGEAPYFGFTVERENGKIALQAFQMAGQLSGVAAVSEKEASVPLDVGDRAAMGIGESQLCVVKGNFALTLNLTQVTDGRTKGIALAKKILPRL